MGKRILTLLIAGAVLCALAGCGSLFEAEYDWSAPFAYNAGADSGNATEISNYNMLKSALTDLINRHVENATFRFSRYNGSVADDLAEACLEVRTATPLGAYAVEALTCDTSRIVSYYTADVNVVYKRTAEEIRDVVGVVSLSELENRLRDTVASYGTETVLRIYSSMVDEDYLSALVESFHLSDPVTVVTEPTTQITSFPGEGVNRIYDIRLDYGATAPVLQLMSRRVSERILEVAGTYTAEAAPQLALECALSLDAMLAGDGDSGFFGSTAYGAIVENAADSKGIALAYKALCDALGIECSVVKGNIGSMGAEEHYWNIIALEGAHYHVDVSAFRESVAGAFLLDDESLWGTYLWDAEAYPACTGGLRYTDVAPEAPPEERPEGGEDEDIPPEETDVPQETEAPVPTETEN